MAFGLFKKSEKKQEPVGPHYHELTVKDIIPETKDSISLLFEHPTSGKLKYKSGQFLTLISTVQGKDVRRAYSLCSSAFLDDYLAVMVKRVDNGLMSNWLPDHLKKGDKVKVLEPMGQFTTEYSKENKRHLVMFAGGSGITPMISILKSVTTQEPDSICSLIYCNRDIDSIIFKNELDQWQTTHEGRVHVIHILDNAPMNWQGYSGLLNKEMLVKLFERIPSWSADKTTYLMCGPEGMMKNVETLLSELQIPKENVFKESFVSGIINKEKKEESKAATVSGNKAHEVTVRYDGQEYKFVVEPNRTILETALDQGIDLPYYCQSGLCTACRGRALSGQVKLDKEKGWSQSEREKGYGLPLVGHPITDDVVIEIG